MKYQVLTEKTMVLGVTIFLIIHHTTCIETRDSGYNYSVSKKELQYINVNFSHRSCECMRTALLDPLVCQTSTTRLDWRTVQLLCLRSEQYARWHRILHSIIRAAK